MESRYVCFECGYETSARDDLTAHWRDEDHGPDTAQRLGIARARGDEPNLVPTEAEVRQSARRRVNSAVCHRRRLRVIDGGRR